MRPVVAILITVVYLSGCVVVPETDRTHVSKCEISSDRKTLRILDISKETNSYYSLSGVFLVPLTGVVSGVYVTVNNIYYLGKEKIVCG